MLQLNPWKALLRALLGFGLGLAIWWGLTPAYTPAVTSVTNLAVRLTERPSVTRLASKDRDVIVNRTDFARKSGRPQIPLHDLTFNIILLTTLFALEPKLFSNRNVLGFLLALGILFVTHVLALLVSVKAIYALKLGPWSLANYGDFARNFYGAVEHFYRLVGMYAIAVAAWWVGRDSRTTAAPATPPRRRKARR